MNYYEHHIRDYATATAHLTWDEDMAYSRLIRWYYRKEMPIPSDIDEACRQIRATTKPQREAVLSVLKEFFALQADGWHNASCDALIERFREGEPEREIKKTNEENRTRKHREERARLFKTLTESGGYAAWNIGIADLRELVSRLPVTAPVTAPVTPVTQTVTAPATPVTATQSPITNHQEVNPLSSSLTSKVVGVTGVADKKRSRNVEIAIFLRSKGVKPFTFAHPQCVEWAGNAAVTDDILTAAVQQARDYKPDGDISPNYLKPIIEQLLSPPKPAPPKADAWWASDAGIERKGKELGLRPQGTETYAAYKDRIFAEIRKREGRAA